MSDYKDVLGEKGPSSDHSSNDGHKYDHWMDHELRGMTRMERTEASADKRAHESGKKGMKGGERPGSDIFERERGDAKTPGRNVDRKFEAEGPDEFDVDQWDRGDERRPSGEGEGAPMSRRLK